MKKAKHDIEWMIGVALMAAVTALLASTPLGMIQLPVIKATTVHIPVILGAVILGPLAGSILGAVFGICSMISNTMAPTLLSFAFSPFMTNDGIAGALKAIWICIGCRILIGLISGWIWILFKKIKLSDYIALPAVGFIGSITNTVLVMGSIYFLLAQEYAAAKQVEITAVFSLIMATVNASGIMEAIVSLILVTAIGKPLLTAVKKLKKQNFNRNKRRKK